MWAGIAAALQIVMLVLKWWFGLDEEKKKRAAELLKEVPNATDSTSAISRMFSDINRM